MMFEGLLMRVGGGLRPLGARALSVAARAASETTTTATVGIDFGTESVRAVVVRDTM